jgi:hypothetical protein
MRVEAVINVAVEVVGAMEPRAGSDEHTAGEPLGPVVAVRGTIVWGEVVVTVRAHRHWSNIGDLCGCEARNAQQSGNQNRKGKKFPRVHLFLLNPKKATQVPKLFMTKRDSHPWQVKGETWNRA